MIEHTSFTNCQIMEKSGHISKKSPHFNKMNVIQKELMSEFMSLHPNLAQNHLTNGLQGKAAANQLWDELTDQLNKAGPPIKDMKTWKKVFADLKYQVKKKLTLNSKNITPAEEMLIEAAGLQATAESNSFLSAYDSTYEEKSNFSIENEEAEASSSPNTKIKPIVVSFTDETKVGRKTRKKRRKTDPKLLLLEQNIDVTADFHKKIMTKLDRFLQIQERMLKIKEQTHEKQMAIAEVELHIKTMQLESLIFSPSLSLEY